MKINDRLSNIDFKNKKYTIEKEILEYEDRKSEKIFELGISAYEKIRNGIIDEALFFDICLEIKKLDLEIYNRFLDIKELEQENNASTCECGELLTREDKFCRNCGKPRYQDTKNTILCDVCASKIDKDSNFCVCCGSQIKKPDVQKSDEDIEDEIELEAQIDTQDLKIDLSKNEEVKNNEDEEIIYKYEESINL